MKDLLRKKWDSLLLSFTTILYAFQIVMFPHILERYQVYQIIDEYFNRFEIAGIFLILAILKLIGVFTNNTKIRRFSLVGLASFWMLFSVSFLFSSPPNTMWILSGSLSFLAIGIAYRENFND
ncbi:MAG: hypothetical protein H9W83_12455 [Leuconostoc sp.]|nr:hypothetical protein [Leuconostoc sp.]